MCVQGRGRTPYPLSAGAQRGCKGQSQARRQGRPWETREKTRSPLPRRTDCVPTRKPRERPLSERRSSRPKQAKTKIGPLLASCDSAKEPCTTVGKGLLEER